MGIGVKIAQTLLFAFNFAFTLFGLACIIIGAIIRVKYSDYEHLTKEDVGAVSILLIALGGIIFIVAFFGCCGAIRKSVIMLTIFIVLMVILLVIEVAAAITAFAFKDKMKDYIGKGMEHALKNYNQSEYRDAFDTVQKELKCCGKNSSYDYLNDHYPIPPSCCKNKSKNVTCTANNAYKEGCEDALFDYLEEHMKIIGGFAVGVAVIQIIGIVFACLVRRDVKEGYGYV